MAEDVLSLAVSAALKMCAEDEDISLKLPGHSTEAARRLRLELRLNKAGSLLLQAMALSSALALSGYATAQSKGAPEQPPGVSSHATPAASTDLINQVVSDFYQAISAPAGAKLDRTRLQALFVPGGRIGSVYPPHGTTPAAARFVSPDEYADGSDRFTEKYGFFDHVLHNRIEEYGLMAHVYSAYESRNDPKDKHPMARGIKSIELLQSNGKWYIVQVYWNSETAENPIPPEYLGS